MHIALFVFLVVVVMALVLWAIQEAPKIDGTLRAILRVAVILLAAAFIASRAGWI